MHGSLASAKDVASGLINSASPCSSEQSDVSFRSVGGVKGHSLLLCVVGSWLIHRCLSLRL